MANTKELEMSTYRKDIFKLYWVYKNKKSIVAKVGENAVCKGAI